MKTRLTELLGIDVPIVLPGMSWISKPPLVAAVSEAGGLGILAAGPLRPDETRAAIRAVRERTDRPFGVGLTLMMPGAAENTAVVLEEKVPVVNFALGRGERLIESVHAYGGKAIATIAAERHALSAERAGVDAVLLTGHEAAGHGSRVGSMVLVPAVARAVSVPVIAAGGFADGRGLVAALALGASGVAMGTRFAACAESDLHENVKQAIVEKGQAETIYSNRFDGMWARVMRTPAAVKATDKPMSLPGAGARALGVARKMEMPVGKVLAGLVAAPDRIRMLASFGAAIEKVEAATINGDLERGVQFIGQTQGLVNDLVSAGEIVRRTLDEARDVQKSVGEQLAEV